MMDLPSQDHAFLQAGGFEYEIFDDSNVLCVQVSNLALPPGLSAPAADILFRFAPLYPDVPPDMWWVSPALTTIQGTIIPATELHETYRQRSWQRWSRHLPDGTWLAGIDGLQSYFALLQSELRSAAGAAA
ncbi:E2/UBC family protein [Streptomyces sp. NPDC127119]|uniref:E2/UBC family protein n=1 Tax=Streptomyces sp. NPDC127119 TaxID=3345370 RepID=UPI0036413D73